MARVMAMVVFASFVMLATEARADVYKYVDANGNTYLFDSPVDLSIARTLKAVSPGEGYARAATKEILIDLAHLSIDTDGNGEISLFTLQDISKLPRNDKKCREINSFPKGSSSGSTIPDDCNIEVMQELRKLAIDCDHGGVKLTVPVPEKHDVDKLLFSVNKVNKIYLTTKSLTSPARISSITSSLVELDESYELEVYLHDGDAFIGSLRKAIDESSDFLIIIGDNKYIVRLNTQVKRFFSRFIATCQNPRVEWKPGQKHPRQPGLIAAEQQDSWRPAEGWAWLNDDDQDVSVTKQEYSGLGLEFNFDAYESTGEVQIMNIFPDSPAGHTDLRRGMILRSVDGISTKRRDANGVLSLLKGQDGQKFLLVIFDPVYKKEDVIPIIIGTVKSGKTDRSVRRPK